MPPAGEPRPDGKTVRELVSWLENEIDTAAALVHLRRISDRSVGN